MEPDVSAVWNAEPHTLVEPVSWSPVSCRANSSTIGSRLRRCWSVNSWRTPWSMRTVRSRCVPIGPVGF